MLKKILAIVIPMLTPFVIYYLWYGFYKKKPQKALPLVWLFLAGVVLTGIALFYVAATDVQFQ